jgi:phage terminase large subunit-like protein
VTSSGLGSGGKERAGVLGGAPAAAVLNAETFDLDTYLSTFDPALLAEPEGRRVLTRLDPLLFALLYMPHHLRAPETGDVITFGDLHLDLFEQALSWVVPPTGPRADRDAYVAPRGSGKSTLLFTILPLWAAAHGHRRFAAAFAHSGGQAEMHLKTFKGELDNNQLLRHDFPQLCTPATRPRGTTVSDNQGMLHCASGFVFAAKGIDAQALGMKVGSARPDLIIMDDVEPDEANYSAYQVNKRLTTITDAVLPLNEYARVVLVGTVTMPGSIVHQLVRSVRGEDVAAWITDGNWRVHHYDAIVTRNDGTERSMWPGKWTIVYLLSIRHTRDYKKNFANDPMGADGAYWTEADFIYGDVEGITRWLISVDPTISTKTSSDFTGIALVGFSPSAGQVLIEHAEEVKLTGAALRKHLLRLLAAYPKVRAVLVETNQGGETWVDTFHDLPPGVTLVSVHQTVKKEIRAAGALTHYQRRRVKHARRLHAAEEQMVTFPKAPNDDMVDAVGAGVSYFLDPAPPRKQAGIKAQSYV